MLALHGTGGDERSLVGVSRHVAPGAPLVSVRGKSLDEGIPRFFRRLAEGVFDQQDLRDKTEELARFLEGTAAANGLSLPYDAIGYSNGANMALSLLFTHPTLIGDVIALRPMVPFEPGESPRLEGHRIFISSGRNDPIVDASEPLRLEWILRELGASVEVAWQETGHNLNRHELDVAKDWYAS